MTPENRWARAVAEIAARDGITVDEASTNLASLLASLPPAPQGLPRERLAIRTDSRTSTELLRAHVDSFGYTTHRLVPKSKRRQWVFNYLGAPDQSKPVYQHELKN